MNRQVSSEYLANAFGVSWRTIQRDIAEARRLGAELVSERTESGYIWKCENWGAIEAQVWAVLDVVLEDGGLLGEGGTSAG